MRILIPVSIDISRAMIVYLTVVYRAIPVVSIISDTMRIEGMWCTTSGCSSVYFQIVDNSVIDAIYLQHTPPRS